MINSIFLHSNVLEKGLDAAWLRNNVITNNLSNSDTPNFKASRVEFESVLKNELYGGNAAAMKKTDARHMSPGGLSAGVPAVVEDTESTMRMDGNNVSVENEEANLAENAIYYNLLLHKLKEEYSRLRFAANDGKQ